MEQLQEVESKVLDLRQQLAAAEHILQHTEIRAPRFGRVVATKVHTEGGVIGAGDPIMDIVPDEERLLVDAPIDAVDINVVNAG